MTIGGTYTKPEVDALVAATLADRERESEVLRLFAETTLLRAQVAELVAPAEHYEHALIRAIGITCGRHMGICSRLSTASVKACLKGEPS